MNFIDKIKSTFIGNTRQSFHVGWLASGATLEDLRTYLHREWGFGGNFKTSIHKDEVLNWRKLISKDEQYHLFLFNDGEFRGNFEYTPEARSLNNFFKLGKVDKNEDFRKFLGDFAVQKKYISNLVVSENTYDPNSEIIKEEQTSAPQ